MPKSKLKGAYKKKENICCLEKSSRTLKKERKLVSIKKIENKNKKNESYQHAVLNNIAET